MLRFFLDKLRTSAGPFKESRQIVGDVLEEALDIAEHYIKRFKDDTTETSYSCDQSDHLSVTNQASDTSTVSSASSADITDGTGRKPAKKPEPQRVLDVAPELAAAFEVAANRKKQEFKVLAILWDASKRDLGSLSAKHLSEHGEKLGLLIRHENIRKVIRMRLENYVDIHQNRRQGHPLYSYRITSKGDDYFTEKYLS